MGDVIARNREDRAGLVIAVALHLGVVGLLLLQPAPLPFADFEERMTVSLASEVSLEATSPRPAPETRASIASTLSDEARAPVVDPPPVAEPTQAPTSSPSNPTRSAAITPSPTPDRERTPSDQTPSPERTPTPTATPTSSQGSRIGDDFLSGKGSSSTADDADAPALTFGRRERAALASAITRQLRPHWNAPSGVDAERLESIVTWRLNPDGSLQGRPRCRNVPSSVTPSNRPQAGLHCERAIRAVQLAAPFNLPEPYYNRWKELEWEFNRRL
ncbi:MAG: energy transducer TonB [Pseudomonadota bacterium]